MTKGIVYAVYHQGVEFCGCFYALDDAMTFCNDSIKKFWEDIYGHEVCVIHEECVKGAKWLVGHITNQNEHSYDYAIKTIEVR